MIKVSHPDNRYGEVPDFTTCLILAVIGAGLFWFAVVCVNSSRD